MKTELILTDSIKKELDWTLKLIDHSSELAKRNFKPVWSILLAGPPGCGKTTLAHDVSKHLGLTVVEKETSSIVESYMGSSGKNISNAFDEAINKALVLNEFDAISMNRDANERSAAEKEQVRLTSTILQLMDRENRPRILIATTNHIDSIDKAILRRFCVRINFEKPAKEVHEKLASSMCEKHGFSIKDIPSELYLCNEFLSDSKRNIERFMIQKVIENKRKKVAR